MAWINFAAKKPELTALGTLFLLYTGRNNFTTWRPTGSPIILALPLSIPIASAQPDVDMCHPDPGRHRAPLDETGFLDRLSAVGEDWHGQECFFVTGDGYGLTGWNSSLSADGVGEGADVEKRLEH